MLCIRYGRSMEQKRNGFAAVFVLVIVVVVILAGAGYFFFIRQSPTLPKPSSSSSTSFSSSNTLFEVVKDANVRRHLENQARQTTYRIKTNLLAKGMYTITDYQSRGEDFRSRTQEFEGQKEIAHKIDIGDTTYVKDFSDGKWWKQTSKPEEVKKREEEFVKNSTGEIENTKLPEITFTFVGMEACGNLNCFKYEHGIPGEKEAKRVFWFDDKQYLLRKEEVGFGEFKVVNEYSYDGINITPPSPTKEVPAGKSIYEYYNASAGDTPTQPSQEEIEKMMKQFENSTTPDSESP